MWWSVVERDTIRKQGKGVDRMGVGYFGGWAIIRNPYLTKTTYQRKRMAAETRRTRPTEKMVDGVIMAAQDETTCEQKLHRFLRF